MAVPTKQVPRTEEDRHLAAARNGGRAASECVAGEINDHAPEPCARPCPWADCAIHLSEDALSAAGHWRAGCADRDSSW